MFERLREDVTAFGATSIDWVRVAVLPEHVDEYDLPTAPPKATDRRGAFTGTETVQAEALPPDLLIRLVVEAVEAEWDADAAEAVDERQAEARVELRDVLERVNELLGEAS